MLLLIYMEKPNAFMCVLISLLTQQTRRYFIVIHSELLGIPLMTSLMHELKHTALSF